MGADLDWRRGGTKLVGERGGETTIRIYFIK